MLDKKYEAKINSVDDFKLLMRELETLDSMSGNAETLDRIMEIKDKVKIVIDRIDVLLDKQ